VQFEIQVKREFRSVVHVWSESYEPGLGSGVGYPDLQLLAGDRLMPVELKVGRIDKDRIKCRAIKPSQISWHDEFMKAGGRSWIVAGWIEDRKLNAWAIPSVRREVTSAWREGWLIDDCVCWVARGRLCVNLLDIAIGKSDIF
jgi:hypothetical protein